MAKVGRGCAVFVGWFTLYWSNLQELWGRSLTFSGLVPSFFLLVIFSFFLCMMLYFFSFMDFLQNTNNTSVKIKGTWLSDHLTITHEPVANPPTCVRMTDKKRSNPEIAFLLCLCTHKVLMYQHQCKAKNKICAIWTTFFLSSQEFRWGWSRWPIGMCQKCLVFNIHMQVGGLTTGARVIFNTSLSTCGETSC